MPEVHKYFNDLFILFPYSPSYSRKDRLLFLFSYSDTTTAIGLGHIQFVNIQLLHTSTCTGLHDLCCTPFLYSLSHTCPYDKVFLDC